MTSSPTCTRLDADRWHFQHGPIDLVIGVADVAAIERAWLRFGTVLQELVAELPLLRRSVQQAEGVHGVVARRMVAACRPHGDRFITPMAAVAGAVADEILAVLASGSVDKAYVNNGGDIALHLGPGERYRVGLVADIERATRHGHRIPLDGAFEITAAMPVRGVATSGWRGRSFSLGIADSVTVLAANAAAADAAATMIANEVNVDDAAVVRRPACELKDDTDLGDRLVTVDVGPLSDDAVELALTRGETHARLLCERGVIWGAVLALRDKYRVAGGVAAARLER